MRPGPVLASLLHLRMLMRSIGKMLCLLPRQYIEKAPDNSKLNPASYVYFSCFGAKNIFLQTKTTGSI